MKKIILLGLVIFITNLSFAQDNRSAAEVFLRINTSGKFSVYLDDELVSSSTGRFRFYDVYNSMPTLSIIQGNKVVLKQKVNVYPEQRIVYSFVDGKLETRKRLNIYQNRNYALDDFDQNINDNGTSQIEQPINSRTLSPEAFQAFKANYNKENFDDGRTRLINIVIKTAALTTAQAKLLLKAFAFDNDRLKVAKNIYKNVADPQNYFTLADVFQFKSNKDEFLEFLEND